MCKNTDVFIKAVKDSGLSIVSACKQGRGKHPSFMVTDGKSIRRCPYTKSPSVSRNLPKVYRSQLRRKFNL